MRADYASIFWELIRKPFEHTELVWGIVPLYFSWMFAELTGTRATYNTAIQTGFNLLWAGAQWCWQSSRGAGDGRLDLSGLFAVNVIVTIATILLGALALSAGVRRRFPKYGSFLGHARFSSYLTIVIFPIQSNYLKWSWDRLAAIAMFAVPTWLILHYGLAGLRAIKGAKKKKK